MNAIAPSTPRVPDGYGVLTAPDTLRVERLLPGPIERVWRYLTESEARSRWLAAGPMDLRVGGAVAMTFRNSELSTQADLPPPKYTNCGGDVPMQGRITVCEPPRALAYTWGEERGEPSEVRFDLDTIGKQVQLVITHRRLSTRDALLSVSAGWHAHLDILVDRLHAREPGGFWTAHTRLEAEYERRLPQS